MTTQAPTAPATRRAGVRAASWLVLVVGLAGLVLFAAQVEDSTPMFLYFTIWCATVTTLIWPAVDLVPVPLARVVARAGAVGSVLAGIVYWAVLAPAYGVGRLLPTVLANIALHALLPIAVLVRLVAGREPRASWVQEVATLWLPVLYLVFTFAVLAPMGIPSPYPFLQRGANLWISIPVLTLVWLAIAALLHGVVALMHRRRGA